MLTLTGMLEPPRIANYLSPLPLYSHCFCSFDGKRLTASNGLFIDCELPPERLGSSDLVLVFGSWGGEHYQNPKLLSWLRLQSRLGARLCAVEIGSYFLARAGLLAQKPATTHWSYLSGFREQFPDVEASEQIFTESGNIMTCSGGTAGIDLILDLVRRQHGARLAAEISDQIMHHQARPPETPQRLTLGSGVEALPDVLRAAVELIEANISEPLSVPQIAEEIGRSQRQLERLFTKFMGCSVVQFGLLMRLQHARVLLISTDLGVREIAIAAGFNSLSHFAFAFKKCFGWRPSDYRQSWPEQEPSPQWPGSLSRFLDSIEIKRRLATPRSGGLS